MAEFGGDGQFVKHFVVNRDSSNIRIIHFIHARLELDRDTIAADNRDDWPLLLGASTVNDSLGLPSTWRLGS